MRKYDTDALERVINTIEDTPLSIGMCRTFMGLFDSLQATQKEVYHAAH